MSIFNLHHLGRWGNTMFGYAFARGYCERHGLELHMDPWIGEQIFDISHPRCSVDLPRMEETDIHLALKDVSYRSYSQSQVCADHYTISQCRRWFKFRPHITASLALLPIQDDIIVAHLRHGDFKGYNYPLVSEASYLRACEKFGLMPSLLKVVREEEPMRDQAFGPEMDFLPDFWRLLCAPVLFRANSSFSFWAAALGQHRRVFSPVIDGLLGGVEHDVQFIEGNHPRLSDHSFVTEIVIAP